MLWLDSAVCWFRVPGDIALASSFPILWYRLYHLGATGVSLETQILHLVTFIARYVRPDFFEVSWYNSLFKIWYIGASAVGVLVLLCVFKAPAPRVTPARLLMLLPCANGPIATCIPFLFSYLNLSIINEISWMSSQVLAAFAMVPQLILMYQAAWPASVSKSPLSLPLSTQPEKASPLSFSSVGKTLGMVAGIDGTLWAYVASVAAFRVFYIRHWVWRWQKEGFLDPIAQVTAVIQLLVISAFLVSIYVKVALIRRRANYLAGEEEEEDDEFQSSKGALVWGTGPTGKGGPLVVLDTIDEAPEEDELVAQGDRKVDVSQKTDGTALPRIVISTVDQEGKPYLYRYDLEPADDSMLPRCTYPGQRR